MEKLSPIQNIKQRVQAAKDLGLDYYERYESYFPALSFIAGFLYDVITTERIDEMTTLLQQIIFIGLAFAIVTIELIKNYNPEFKIGFMEKLWEYHSFAIHFLLGGLLSAYTIFYFKAASLSTSLIFMVFLAGLLVANEHPKLQGLGTRFRNALLAVCTLSFMIYLIPILTGQLGFFVFLLSQITSGLIFAGVAYFLFRLFKDKSFILREVLYPAFIVHVFVFALYLFKAIPPVPLAMTHIGIYHKVEKFKDQYQVLFDKPWWKFWTRGSEDFVAQNGDRIYVFAKIFSPTQFQDTVYAHWQIYMDKIGEWKTSDRVPIEIRGGRNEGFRGVSFKSNYEPGEWRVLVETSDGREIGRVHFDLQKSNNENLRTFQSEWH